MTMDRKNTTEDENVIKDIKRIINCEQSIKKVIKIINKCNQDTKNVKTITRTQRIYLNIKNTIKGINNVINYYISKWYLFNIIKLENFKIWKMYLPNFSFWPFKVYNKI